MTRKAATDLSGGCGFRCGHANASGGFFGTQFEFLVAQAHDLTQVFDVTVF